LSDPDANAVFIVERDGRVWQYDETVPGRPAAQRTPQMLEPYTLFHVQDYLPGGPFTWRWRGGWEPTLQILGRQGEMLELLACGDELWLRTPDRTLRFPGGAPVNADRMTETIEQARSRWERWFAEGRTIPSIDPWWDAAWRSSLIQARSIYAGLHPRYGVATYTEARSDGFPPTTLSMVSALAAFGHIREALDIFGYFLDRFILPDGSIDYYGPSISEYGALLVLTGEVADATGVDENFREWLFRHESAIWSIQKYLVRCRNPYVSPVDTQFGLIIGSPEADTREDRGAYFHNNMMAWCGLRTIAGVWKRFGWTSRACEAAYIAADFERRVRNAVASLRRPREPLPVRTDKPERFQRFDESRDAAYANYRYYPEMLESGFLDREEAMKIVRARETRGGERFGMTVFTYPGMDDCCDDWPICSYAKGLLRLGEHRRFLNVLRGHAMHHQTRDTFTAYEIVHASGAPRRAWSDWCVPAQVALPRMLAWAQDAGLLQELGGPL